MGKTRISIIVAAAKNNVIGLKGEMPWHLKADLQRFKKITDKHSVIMGRKTAESINRRLGKPLPGRRNILITRHEGFILLGFEIVHSFQEAVELVKFEEESFVIGGAEIYALALPIVDLVYLTRVFCEPPGDAFFPELDDNVWTRRDVPGLFLKNPENDFDHSFCVLERGKGGSHG